MNTNKYIKLIGTIVGIICFIVLIAGISYAWLAWNSSNTNIAGNTECFNVQYTNGQTISNANLLLLDQSNVINGNKVTVQNGMAITDVTAYINSSCNIYANLEIVLNVTQLNSAFISGSSKGAFKYVIASYDPSTYSEITTTALDGLSFDIIKYGSIRSTGEISLINETLPTKEKGYLLIFYVDGDLAMNDAQNSKFTATITGTATQIEPATLMDHITNLYINTAKTAVTNNNIDYNYATEVNLMNDRQGSSSVTADGGNIRYYGSNPNNYIYFNCSDYSNQSSSTCEKWRIIGIVDGKVKIIRNESIGTYSWDNKNKITGFSEDYGSNNWSNARLMRLLNPGYENYIDKDNSGNNLIANNSLYWNGTNGTCYKGQHNATVSCNFTSTGLKNDTTREMISESTWYLGGHETFDVYSNEIYSYERTYAVGTTVHTGNQFTIKAKAGLMYLSDYGYAADFLQCSDTIDVYSNNICKENNWIFNGGSQWTITHRSVGITSTFYVLNTANAGQHYVFRTNGVRPTVYLEPTLMLAFGTDGSYNDPYQLLVR